MIPAIATAPVMSLRPQEVESLVEALHAYHAIYSPLFQRREQRHWSADYLQGLLLDVNAIRAMQQFVSDGAWDDDAILKRHWRAVDAILGDEEGVLTLDGSDFLKQGKESVGVKHQYCGEVGKRANCQAGVFVGYASALGSTLLDRRLYLPIEWVEDDDFAERRVITEGSKGPIVADFWAMRVVAGRDGLSGPEVWLVLRRQLETGELKTYVCNAPATTSLERWARLSGMRWPIEAGCEEGKQYLGMSDYEVRSWRGWHHHMTLCLLAHFFLVRQQQRLKKT